MHSYYKLPVPIQDGSTCNIPSTSQIAQEIRETQLFIIDEASMIPKHALDAIDILFRDLMQNDVPFGGKIFLLGGDFRQILPVIPHANPAVLLENTIKKAKVYEHFETFHLKINMRANKDEKDFAEWLLKIGNGQQTTNTDLPSNSMSLPQEIVCDNVVHKMYNSSNSAYEAILTPKNEACFQINDEILKKMPETSMTYYSSDKIECDNSEERDNYPTEFINSLTPSGMPRHKLCLKERAMIMLLRNLDIKQGLCNGTRLRICRLHRHVIDAEVLSTKQRVLIPRIKLSPSDTRLPFQLQRTQFPVRLAFCMTINKAQGQTFHKVGLFLPEPVFTHGQLYVALSRARSFKDIHVQVYTTSKQGYVNGDTYTQNIVFKEVL